MYWTLKIPIQKFPDLSTFSEIEGIPMEPLDNNERYFYSRFL